MYYNDAKQINMVNVMYHKLLGSLNKVVSVDDEEGTNQSELDKSGQALFTDRWGGSKTLDRWDDIRHDPYKFYIMNTVSMADSEQIGHWLAVHDGKIWDSFHRPLRTIVPTLSHVRPFTELNYLSLQNQPDSSSDCGERCLAALELYRRLFLQ